MDRERKVLTIQQGLALHLPFRRVKGDIRPVSGRAGWPILIPMTMAGNRAWQIRVHACLYEYVIVVVCQSLCLERLKRAGQRGVWAHLLPSDPSLPFMPAVNAPPVRIIVHVSRSLSR